MDDLYFEDFAVGDTFVTDSESVSEEQIIRFAKEWDPQPFHTDIEAANRHELGGLIASGLHTLAVSFRLFIATQILAACNIAGAGLDNLRWPRPVRPGDILHVEVETTEVRPSRSRPDRGSVAISGVRALGSRMSDSGVYRHLESSWYDPVGYNYPLFFPHRFRSRSHRCS